MENQKKTIVRRSVEERVAEIDGWIANAEKRITSAQAKIVELQAQREKLLNPPVRTSRNTVNKIIGKAKENGMTIEEIAEKLGVEL